MRVTGVLCSTLLLVGLIGSTSAYPQYGGVPQNQQQQVPVDAVPAQGAAVSDLTDEQVAALGEFWWQNSGVFEGPNTDGTVVVVQEQNSAPVPQVPEEVFASPFIPTPSPNCDTFHGCIPWQYCPNGVFTNTGEGLLALRTPSKPPADFDSKLCGQIGNICCRIPDALLAAQQQGQSDGPAAPYGGGDGSLNDDIIEAISNGAGGIIVETTIEEQSASGAIAETGVGPYGGNPDGGIVSVGNSTDNQQQGAVDVGIVEVTPSVCPLYTHDCVPYFQCTPDGEINTSGAGLIDIRIKPRKECTNPEYPEVPGLCCRIPGATTPAPTGPIPLKTCPGTRVCVSQGQCNADGIVNTDGVGLIDTRLYSTCYLNYVDDSNFEAGICCEPPQPAVPLETCPETQFCVGEGLCSTFSTASYNPSSITNCYQIGGTVGECCDQAPAPPPLDTCPGDQVCVGEGVCASQGTASDNPSSIKICYQSGTTLVGKCCDPPTPATSTPIVTCSGTQECVEAYQCNGDGTINTDGAGLINVRLYNKPCYLDQVSYKTGVCCQPPTPAPPVTPAPLETCPGAQICQTQEICTSQSTTAGVAVTNYTLSCVYDTATYVTGVCCDPPPPVTPSPLETCPGVQVCQPQAVCTSQSTNTGIAVTSYSTTCILDVGSLTAGVCCDPPLPVTPAPLETCPDNLVCLSQDACTEQSALSSGVGLTYTTSCVLNPETYATGVCCESPIRVVDVCPGDSVCIPEILCQGNILNDDELYVPYDNAGTWTQCPLSGDIGTPGVCCRNPVATPSPYTASNQCGVRNYGLDLRTPVKLEKDEAQFGEFPWQAIIFFTNFTYKCGASIIDTRWLITAAHCVHGYQYGDFKVRLGEWQVDKYDEPLKYEDYEIASISVHPNFKPGPVHNDVALIELATAIQPQYHINSLCLPELNQLPVPGSRCFASGWGKNAFNGNFQPILKKVDLPIVEKSYCQELLRKTRLGKWFVLDKSFMCAGGEELVDTCEGDGGGPLACEDPVTGRYFIAGITAWGIDCGKINVPGVYADVQLFRPWINEITGLFQGASQQQEQQQQASNSYGRK